MKNKTVLEIVNDLETQNFAPKSIVYSDERGEVYALITHITSEARVNFIARYTASDRVRTFLNLIDALAYLKAE